MPIRSNAQREDRRRRVLRDDRSGNDSASESSSKSKTATRSAKNNKQVYASEARREHQPVITDFVPRRSWTLCVVFLLGLCCVAATQSLFVLTHLPNGLFTADELQALRLSGPSTVSAWLSAFFLGGAAIVAFVIYLVRRHRLDDYRAGYRWWLGIAVVLMIASLNASTHLHLLIPTLMVQWTGREIIAGGSIWNEIIVGSFAALLAIRMGIEMRASRMALAAMCFSIIGFVLYSLMRHGILLSDSAVLAEMGSAALRQLSHLMIVMAFVSYCRHVYLDAHGELAAKSAKRTTTRNAIRKKTSTSQRDGKATKKQAASRAATASTSPKRAASEDATTTPTEEDDESGEATLEFQQMSKSERRRLRKQQRRERQAA